MEVEKQRREKNVRPVQMIIKAWMWGEQNKRGKGIMFCFFVFHVLGRTKIEGKHSIRNHYNCLKVFIYSDLFFQFKNEDKKAETRRRE